MTLMKTPLLPIGFVLGLAAAAACGPSQPANTADDGASATASSTAEAGAGGASSGGATGAAPSEGGAPSGSASASSGGGGAGGAASSGTPTPAQLVASGDAANGAKLFESEHCNGCHGTKAKGPTNGKFPNLFKLTWDDKEIEKSFGVIKKGKIPMPPYGDKLQDKQIGDILAFIKTAK